MKGSIWLLIASLAACSETVTATAGDGGALADGAGAAPRCPNDVGGASYVVPLTSPTTDTVDLLLVIDNSGSMRDNQTNFARNVGGFLQELMSPSVDPATGRARGFPVRSLHVGVVSTDLGTPGVSSPGCADSDFGDDGLLNPIRNGLAIRTHQPWVTAMPGVRPTRCENRADQYPNFLAFDGTGDAAAVRDDVVCNAYLSVGGCGLEQQLEAAYRALVIRNARAGVAGNMDPNAGFVRDDAVLAILVLSDEEDGSVRDCRYAESGDPDGLCRPGGRGPALGVFDSTDPNWASADLNLRFYMYTSGSQQDPTWPLSRYIDPMRPNRGFTSLKPGRPDLVIFGAITGVPIELPQLPGTRDPTDPANIDWTFLLGTRPDGSDGYVAMSPEGPISMRQRNNDPNCATRVVPACRREGSTYDPMVCDTTRQYFAWPSRRIAEVARRFAITYQNAALSSICRIDYSGAFAQIAGRIRRRVVGPCLTRRVETTPPICCDERGAPAGCVAPGATARGCVPPSMAPEVRLNCTLRETLPSTVRAADWCVPARGRTFAGMDENRREVCIVNHVAVVPGQRPVAGEGFYFDTAPPAGDAACVQRVGFTDNARLAPGAAATLACRECPNS